jgi:mitotic spindle assembly checkpoint protein MAD1
MINLLHTHGCQITYAPPSMSSPPPHKRGRLSSSRTPLSSARKSLGASQSALPRASTSINVNRLTNTQPSYDFIGGGLSQDAAPPLKRSVLRQSQTFKQPTIDHAHDEGLRAKINAQDYELKNLQQEKSVITLQHEKELRELQARAEADFKARQAAEIASKKATQRYEQIARELSEAQDQSINEKASLERRLRDLQEQNATLKEDAEDAQSHLTDQERQYKYQINDIEAKRASLQETVDQLKHDLEQTSTSLEVTQQRLARRDADFDSLENQVRELRSHTTDSDALGVIQRELSDQVTHIRKLESTNREQLTELRKLRDSHRSVQVVEEQKRSLETELQSLKDVYRQLGEAHIQKEILEDEKRTWTSLLEREGHDEEFESPEAVVKALVQERIEHASFVDRLGRVESDLAEKDEIIKALESEKISLREEIERVKASPAASVGSNVDVKAFKRLERQHNLAAKEVEYLRAQLKNFDTEETMMMENQNFDAQRSEQVQKLEFLVDQYKTEVSTLHSEMSRQERSQPTPPPEPRGTKRSADTQEVEDDSTSQLGPLLRKNKNLQTALQKSAQQSQLLATELQAAKSQLKSLRASSKIRVLELRDNPTANAEAIKMSTLATLKAENTALLQQLRGEDMQGVKVVPISTVDALKLDLKEMEKVVAEKEKRMRRLREIWTDKAAEFRDVIASVLGYKVIFLPNGKVKLGSLYYGGRHDVGDLGDSDLDENFIMFDGENGTMKISGGPDGVFGQEIAPLVQVWVKGKGDIPAFLAAMTLSFHEKYLEDAS